VTLDLAEQDELDDGMVLAVLLDSNQPGLWSADELIRALGNRVSAADSLMRLERDGLVHRLGQFVFPTRAAVRAGEIQV
jgi:hypothetical protein